MTDTLDDVVCLLDIPITKRLIEDKELSYERGLELLEDELGLTDEDVIKEVKNQRGLYVNYTNLRRRYESLLNKCNQLEDPASEEEAEEQSVVKTVCIKAFLLLLIGYTIFVG